MAVPSSAPPPKRTLVALVLLLLSPTAPLDHRGRSPYRPTSLEQDRLEQTHSQISVYPTKFVAAMPAAGPHADPWDVNSSDGGSGGSDAEGPAAPGVAIDSGAVVAVVARGTGASRRKRGRPRGTPGNPAQRRRMHERARELAAISAEAHTEQAVVVAEAPALPELQARMAMLIRPIGFGLARIIGNLLHSPCQSKEHVDKLLDLCHGSAARGSVPLWAEARLLGTHRRRLPADFETLGASLLFCNRQALSCWFSFIMRNVQGAGPWRPIATILTTKYDETPLSMRCPESGCSTALGMSSLLMLPEREIASAFEASSDDDAVVARESNARRSTKVYHLSIRFAVIVQDRTSGSLHSMEAPALTPLVTADGGTASVVRAVHERVRDVPFWSSLCEIFPHTFEAATCDSAASNLTFERARSQEHPRLSRLTLRCRVHILNSVQGKTYLAVAPLISGMIATSLAMAPAGSIRKFRSVLKQELLRRLVVVPSTPPPPGDPRRDYRDQILALCLSSGSARDEARREVLTHLMNGNWCEQAIVWYTRDATPNQARWASQVARALLPSAWELFLRHRWLNKIDCLFEATLLCSCHDLFSAVVPKWVVSLQGLRRPPKETCQSVAGDTWEVDENEGGAEDLGARLDRPRRPVDGDWAAFNETNRGDAGRFAAGAPLHQLVVVTVTLAPQVALMTDMLHVAGHRWREQQLAEALHTGQMVRTRLFDTFSCRATEKFSRDILDLMTSRSQWAAMPAAGRTFSNRSLAFSMLSRGLGGVFANLHCPAKQYPYRLWGLLGPSAEQLATEMRDEPHCLRCPFASAFHDEFGQEGLLSPVVQGCLLVLGFLADVDISETECLHASVRRLLRGRTQTWSQTHAALSADWVMCRSRIFEHGTRRPVADKMPAARKQRQQQGGGPARAFFSRFLRGAQLPTPDHRRRLFAEGHTLYKAQKERGGAENEADIARGRIGRLASRAGGLAFCEPTPSREALALAAEVADALQPGSNQEALVDPLVHGRADNSDVFALAEILRPIRQRVAQQRAEHIQEDKQRWRGIIEWSGAQAQSVFAGCGASPAVLPAGATSLRLTHSVWVPPAKEMSRVVLSSMTPSQRTALRQAWAVLHEPIRVADLDKVTDAAPNQQRLCYSAGMCLCGRQGVKIRAFVLAMQKLLRRWLVKGSFARQLYDCAALVLELVPDEAQGEQSHDSNSSFLHLAHGNLQTFRFVVVPLRHAESRLRTSLALTFGRVALEVAVTSPFLGAVNLWAMASGLNLDRPWHCRAWRLFNGKDIVPEFTPKDVDVELVRPDLSADLWQPAGGPKPRGRRQAPRARAGDPWDVSGDVEDAGPPEGGADGGGRGLHPGGPNIADAAPPMADEAEERDPFDNPFGSVGPHTGETDSEDSNNSDDDDTDTDNHGDDQGGGRRSFSRQARVRRSQPADDEVSSGDESWAVSSENSAGRGEQAHIGSGSTRALFGSARLLFMQPSRNRPMPQCRQWNHGVMGVAQLWENAGLCDGGLEVFACSDV